MTVSPTDVAGAPPAMAALLRGWHRVECWVAVLCFAFIAAVLVVDVVGREFYGPLLKLLGLPVGATGLFGSQKLAIFALVIGSFAGIGIATASGVHLVPRLAFGWVPASFGPTMNRVADLFMGLFLLAVAWYGVVFPALLINYFGQGALILKTCGEQAKCTMHPFYDQVPHSFLIPMVILAGLASIIASQAVISGAFSIARQGIQLGFLPRMQVIHTSHRSEGQIYLPAVNWTLFVLVLIVVLAFRSTDNLAAAYGLAVTGAMCIDTVLFAVVAYGLWKWHKLAAAIASSAFLFNCSAAFIASSAY